MNFFSLQYSDMKYDSVYWSEMALSFKVEEIYVALWIFKSLQYFPNLSIYPFKKEKHPSVHTIMT